MPDNSEKNNMIVEFNDRLEVLVEKLIPIRTFLVFLSSVFTVVLSLLIAFYLRHNFSFNTMEIALLPKVILLVVVVKLIVFLFFRLYEGMWRYVSIIDLIKIFSANVISTVILIATIALLRPRYFPGFSLNVLVIDFFICFMAMSGKRVIMRIIREYAAKVSGQQDIRTIVIGSVDHLNSFIQSVSSAPSRRKLIGVLCDEDNIGRSIRGIPVLGRAGSAAKCAKKHNASEILLLPPHSSPGTIREIMNDLEVRNKTCSLRMIPVYSEIAEGNISVSHIKEVEIEDLLGRQPVKLDRTDVAEFVRGKNIMVTGAGGSIGSELCNQIAAYQPELLLLFEFCEYNLYEITRVLKKKYPDLKIISFVGDVRSSENIERALSHNIEVVYHAAAFKHVPLMEQNPTMALDTNVLGSSRIATCCEQAGVKRVILVSTDKAVCPTSIMGASKRIAERVILERPQSSTEFVVVRFGNVLGSSGSVIPLFKQQIKDGGPVTLTSENMVRYFMSIPEAVDLLLQAGAIGNDRDIMVLEMGEQVRIYDMAKKLIELSGLIPGRDIEIKITGIRPGEKEYEELLTDKEKVDRTPYDRIFVARKDNSASPPGIDLEKISQVVKTCETVELRELIFQYIPEHKFNPESR